MSYPNKGLLPKHEIEAVDFVNKYPTCDGRGVVIAILDTGVDPGAAGLQVTSDGKPKIIDIVDCTGDGDVDTSTIKEPDSENTLVGLSGRKLKLGKWKNPTNKYHIGIKSSSFFFPDDAAETTASEKKKAFLEEHRVAKANLQRELDTFDAKHPSSEANSKDLKKDLELQLEQLNDFETNYEYSPPVYDVVTFHDGTNWRVVVDTKENGDLTEAIALTDYRIERKYSTFSNKELLNYSVNVYEDGNVTSIVVHSGSHGTHVAGITSAFYGDNVEENGVAPGAQIVALKIGDQRLKHEETGSALVRALNYVIKNSIDLVNLSFGEPTQRPDVGRFPELINEAVNKHKVLFLSSAGNSGPALSTAGAPGATTSASMGIGAYFSKSMQEALYALREQTREFMYTWSSRGPSYDGHFGVSVCASGGAITSVPNSTFKKLELMNGTSMACPNAVGGLALVLSALKQQGIKYTPWSVRKAAENTARSVADAEIFAVGGGLLQVHKCFNYLANSKQDPEIRYEVSTYEDGQRGLYLRQYSETHKVSEFNLKINVIFHEKVDNNIKVAFSKKIELQSNHKWVQHAQFILLTNNERVFKIRVDPSSLQEGRVHHAIIQGIDTENPLDGPLFRFLITIARPVALPPNEFSLKIGELDFTPGHIERRFIAVPETVTGFKLQLRGIDSETSRRYMVSILQVVPHITFRETQTQKFIDIAVNDKHKITGKLIGGFTLEFTLGQIWNSLGNSKVEVWFEFRGVYANVPATLVGVDGVLKLDVSAPARTEKINVSGSLKKIRQPIKPNNSSIRALSKIRDDLPDKKQIYGLTLSYSFKVEETKATIQIIAPVISTVLYENVYETQTWQLSDSNKRVIGYGDAWPSHYPMTVKKGDYQIRIMLRHDNVDYLDQAKDLTLVIEKELEKSVSLKFYSDVQSAMIDGKKLSNKTLQKGDSVPIYVRAENSLPSSAKYGDQLIGTISLGAKQLSVPFTYVVPLLKPQENKSEENQDEKLSESEKLEQAVFKTKTDFLSKLIDKKLFSDFEKIFYETISHHPNNLQLLQLNLKAVDSSEDRTSKIDLIIGAADLIIKNIDTNKIALNLGMRIDKDDKEAAKERKDVEKQRDILVDALIRKYSALGLKSDAEGLAAGVASELKKWVDIEDIKYFDINIAKFLREKMYGNILKLVKKKLDDTPVTDSNRKKLIDTQIETAKSLGWNHIEKQLQNQKLHLFPVQLPPLF